MIRKINLAIMATGKIANKVCETLVKLDCLKVYAVASRNPEKARSFAEKFNIEKAYGSYEEMLNDPEVDLVYITTPHSEHLKCIEMCAEHKKNIICEKSFTINAKEAEKAFEVCKKNKVFITEAIWCRFVPMAEEIRKIIKSGLLGKILYVNTNLCYNTWQRERIHENALGGGALLDVGIYCLNFLDLVLDDEIEEIIYADADIDPVFKTDKQETVLIRYKNGAIGNIFNSCMCSSDRIGMICGENGFAVVENINNYQSVTVYDNSRTYVPVKTVKAEKQISGYEYEFECSCKAILEGKTETKQVPYSHTVRLMKQMDLIRAKMGLIYPSDK